MNTYSVPMICRPISNQVLDVAVEQYPRLQGLTLADKRSTPDAEVDILIGADYYWNFVTNITRPMHF